MPVDLVPKMVISFSQRAVQNAIKKAKKDARTLRRAGALVRREARRLVRPAKKAKPRPPGQPPRSRSSGLNLRSVFFAWNASDETVSVGPIGFRPNPAPGLHEHGGTARIKVIPSKGFGGRLPGGVKRDAGGRLRDERGRFLTRRQIAGLKRKGSSGRGKRKLKTMTIRVPQRPYMHPALKRMAGKFPALFKDTVR